MYLQAERILSHISKNSLCSQRLAEFKRISPTTACALIASIGNEHDFENGHQLAAWMRLTPSQYSSGGKSKFGKITKESDLYLRIASASGNSFVLISAKKKPGS